MVPQQFFTCTLVLSPSLGRQPSYCPMPVILPLLCTCPSSSAPSFVSLISDFFLADQNHSKLTLISIQVTILFVYCLTYLPFIPIFNVYLLPFSDTLNQISKIWFIFHHLIELALEKVMNSRLVE